MERINQITNILNSVRELDNYILHLQSTAKQLINGEFALELTLEGIQPKKSIVVIDEEGDMVDPDIQEIPTNFKNLKVFDLSQFFKRDMKKTPEVFVTQGIDQSTALRLLAVLLEEKKELKQKYYRELERLGIKTQ